MSKIEKGLSRGEFLGVAGLTVAGFALGAASRVIAQEGLLPPKKEKETFDNSLIERERGEVTTAFSSKPSLLKTLRVEGKNLHVFVQRNPVNSRDCLIASEEGNVKFLTKGGVDTGYTYFVNQDTCMVDGLLGSVTHASNDQGNVAIIFQRFDGQTLERVGFIGSLASDGTPADWYYHSPQVCSAFDQGYLVLYLAYHRLTEENGFAKFKQVGVNGNPIEGRKGTIPTGAIVLDSPNLSFGRVGDKNFLVGRTGYGDDDPCEIHTVFYNGSWSGERNLTREEIFRGWPVKARVAVPDSQNLILGVYNEKWNKPISFVKYNVEEDRTVLLGELSFDDMSTNPGEQILRLNLHSISTDSSGRIFAIVGGVGFSGDSGFFPLPLTLVALGENNGSFGLLADPYPVRSGLNGVYPKGEGAQISVEGNNIDTTFLFRNTVTDRIYPEEIKFEIRSTTPTETPTPTGTRTPTPTGTPTLTETPTVMPTGTPTSTPTPTGISRRAFFLPYISNRR